MKAFLRIALLAALILQRAYALTDNEALNAIAGTTGYTNNGALNFIASGASGAVTTIASASTVDLGASDTVNVSITGTTTITSFGTAAEGVYRSGVFTGALTLTYNGTSLILPNGTSNKTTAAGDTFGALSLGSGNWRVLWYQPKSGSGGGSGDVTASGDNAFTGNNSFTKSFTRPASSITITEATPDTGTITVTNGYSEATIDEATTFTFSATTDDLFCLVKVSNSTASAVVATFTNSTPSTATIPANSSVYFTFQGTGTAITMIGGSPTITDLSTATVATGDELPIYDISAGVGAKTTAGDIAALKISDTAYDATSWNSNTDAPTKNAVRDKIESLGSGNGYVLMMLGASGSGFSPADSTTYYYGNTSSTAFNTNSTANVWKCPKAGTIKVASAIFASGGTASSNESFDINVVVNGTPTAIASVANTAATKDFTNTGLSIAVSVGDSIQFSVVTPAWATNPTQVLLSGFVYIE